MRTAHVFLWIALVTPLATFGAWGDTHHFEAYAEGQSAPPGTSATSHGPTGTEHTDSDDLLEIHFLDVNQGDSTLIVCPNGKTILIDCGTLPIYRAEPDVARDRLRDALPDDYDRVDLLVITHPDSDHYNMLPYVLHGISIGHIWFVGNIFEYKKETFRANAEGEPSKAENNLRNWLRDIGTDRRTSLRKYYKDPEDTPNPNCDCGDAEVYVLAANVTSTINKRSHVANSRSIVLLVEYGDFQAILPGDATFTTERTTVDRYSDDWLDVEVLKMGHHGSASTSNEEEWLEVVQPEVSISSSSYRKIHGHPRDTVVDRLAEYAVEAPEHALRKWKKYKRLHSDEDTEEAIYSTASSGTIVVTTDGSWYDVSYGD
jgi:beta-lactamase superfamily II metal-dependent hydrolase